MTIETHLSLKFNVGLPFAFSTVPRKPVEEARNFLATAAAKYSEDHPDSLHLWLDDDVYLPPGIIPGMVQRMHDNPHVDLLIPMWSAIAENSQPMCWNSAHQFPYPGVNMQPGEPFEIVRAGFHAVLMRPSLLDRVGRNPFTVPTDLSTGEDIAFFDRARAAGAKMFCDTSATVGHVDRQTGDVFIPFEKVLYLEDGLLKRRLMECEPLRTYGGSVDRMVIAQKVAA